MDKQPRIFIGKRYNKERQKSGITDHQLREVAKMVITDTKEGSLGGGIYKKRISLEAGTRGGARTIVAYHHENKVYFIDGWEKKDVPKGEKEIPDNVLKAFRAQSKVLKEYCESQINTAVAHGIYIELPPMKVEKKDD